jgi:hypothetical protein
MRRTSMTAILGTVAFGALLGGCATTVEMGPGYYHYDSRAASTPSVVYIRSPQLSTASRLLCIVSLALSIATRIATRR